MGYSQLRDFWQCPLKHFRRYWVREPGRVSPKREDRMARGSLMQAIVEAFYRQDMWRRTDRDAALFVALDAAKVALNSPPSAVAECAAMLPRLLDTMRRERLVGVRNAVEERVSYIVEGVSIEGRADLIVQAPDRQVTLVDGKAGTTFDTKQLRVYALALAGTDWGSPQRVGTWSYRLGTVTWLSLTASSQAAFRRKLAAVMRRWKTAERHAVTGSHCNSCQFSDDCSAFRLKVRAKQACADVDIPPSGGFVSF